MPHVMEQCMPNGLPNRPTPESPMGMGGWETGWEPPPPPPELQWIPSLEVVTLAVDGSWQVAGFEADMAESEVAVTESPSDLLGWWSGAAALRFEHQGVPV